MAELQAQVNAAAAGTMLTVAAATYGPLDLPKKLDVIGYASIIDGGDVQGKSAVRIHGTAASGAGLEGFAVRRGSTHAGDMLGAVMVDGGAADVSLAELAVSESIFGVRVYGSPRAVITGLHATDVAVGVGLWNAGGHLVDSFAIANVDRMVVNDATAGNDNGGNGFQLVNLQDGKLTTISNGTVANARALSHDYGVDGGAVELFGAADVLIENVRASNCVNFSETGTNPGGGDCARITYRGCVVTGRTGTDHTQDGSVTCNGILGRNLVDSTIESCVFDRLDWWALDFTQGSKYSGSGTRNVRISNCTFILRDGVDRAYSFGTALPPGFASDYNSFVANPSATLARLDGTEYPATPEGFAAWQRVTGLEAHSTLYTPAEWAAHTTPPVTPPPVTPPVTPPPPVPIAPTPASLVDPIRTLVLARGKPLGSTTKYHAERAAINAICKAYTALYGHLNE